MWQPYVVEEALCFSADREKTSVAEVCFLLHPLLPPPRPWDGATHIRDRLSLQQVLPINTFRHSHLCTSAVPEVVPNAGQVTVKIAHHRTLS